MFEWRTLWRITQTEGAVKFSTTAQDRKYELDGAFRTFWIPKTAIGEMNDLTDYSPNWKKCDVQIRDWFLKEHRL